MFPATKSPHLKETIFNAMQSADGMLSVADFMNIVLTDQNYGYYRHVENLGRQGDFVTAPQISSLFCDVIGAFLAYQWERLGCPQTIDLIELGPGQGLLLARVAQAFKHVQSTGCKIHFKCLEINPSFRQNIQALMPDQPVQFFEHIEDVFTPGCPALIIGNEFLDTLPVHQFIFNGQEWLERKIVWDNGICFKEDPSASLTALLTYHKLPAFLTEERAEVGTVLEISPAAYHIINRIAAHITQHNGFCLQIDYGSITPGFGDTLQALKNHHKVSLDQLIDEGGDLSAHVDFYRLAKSININSSLTTQRQFLLDNGIMQRAVKDKAKLTLTQLKQLDETLHRLLSIEQMGQLFKVFMIERGVSQC
jgi:NADH dehydrogenase [ubiquinone] 1 alpha subcomplex assembly factor 7